MAAGGIGRQLCSHALVVAKSRFFFFREFHGIRPPGPPRPAPEPQSARARAQMAGTPAKVPDLAAVDLEIFSPEKKKTKIKCRPPGHVSARETSFRGPCARFNRAQNFRPRAEPPGTWRILGLAGVWPGCSGEPKSMRSAFASSVAPRTSVSAMRSMSSLPTRVAEVPLVQDVGAAAEQGQRPRHSHRRHQFSWCSRRRL